MATRRKRLTHFIEFMSNLLPFVLQLASPLADRLLVDAVRELARTHHAPPWAREDFSILDATRYLQRACSQHEQGAGSTYLLTAATGRLLGAVRSANRDWAHGSFQAECWVRPTEHRNGYALQALQLLAHREYRIGMRRLEVMLPADNIAGVQLSLKLGARQEGRLLNRLLLAGQRYDALVLGVWLPQLLQPPVAANPGQNYDQSETLQAQG